MAPQDGLLSPLSMQKYRRKREGCSLQGSGQSRRARVTRGTRGGFQRESRYRQHLRLQGLPEQVLRLWCRLQGKNSERRDHGCFRSVQILIHSTWGKRCEPLIDFRSRRFDHLFLMLPGGGSLMIAQKTPSSLMALTNSWKSTGFTTYAFTPSL